MDLKSKDIVRKEEYELYPCNLVLDMVVED